MLSGADDGAWMENERDNQTNNTTAAINGINNGGDAINSDELDTFTSFKSLLGVDDNNWYLPSDNLHENNLDFSPQNLLLPSIDASATCSPQSASIFQKFDPNNAQYFFPPKITISNNPLEGNFDMETGFLPMNNGTVGLSEFAEFGSQTQMGVPNFSSDTTHFAQSPGNGFGSPAFPSLQPLYDFASTGTQPTLLQKRAALRRNSIDTNNGDAGNLVGLHEGINDSKGKSIDGSFDGVDNMSIDESGMNYDSDDSAENGKFEEIGIKIVGGDSSNANSTVTGAGGDEKGKKKKGMPAKNLMAERRRREKLNDRLFTLRSVVPRISKMDRASILGDAIEYLKDLLQRVNNLNQELESMPSSSSMPPAATTGSYPLTTATTVPYGVNNEAFSGALPSPTRPHIRVEVRQREGGAVNIHMFCGKKPGQLLSTIKTLDDLGIDVQQAVISCFNGFALDIFLAQICNEAREVHPDYIKAMLLESAGYNGLV